MHRGLPVCTELPGWHHRDGGQSLHAQPRHMSSERYPKHAKDTCMPSMQREEFDNLVKVVQVWTKLLVTFSMLDPLQVQPQEGCLTIHYRSSDSSWIVPLVMGLTSRILRMVDNRTWKVKRS